MRREVPAPLVQASLFGSRARRQARPDSDVDVLLVFRWLSRDREPYASLAECIAHEVAEASGVPLTPWSVALVDLDEGNRTPMLVDALEDSVPLWWEHCPIRPLPFTQADARRCLDALLTRVEEGSEELAHHLGRRDLPAAARRARDDLVRLCTAKLLARGITRPRRGEAVLHFLHRDLPGVPLPDEARRVLAWAARSFGPELRDEDAPVPVPPGGLRAAARTVDLLRLEVERGARRLAIRRQWTGT